MKSEQITRLEQAIDVLNRSVKALAALSNIKQSVGKLQDCELRTSIIGIVETLMSEAITEIGPAKGLDPLDFWKQKSSGDPKRPQI
jgi:uncharacterized protein with PhoU and TrkA domain